MVQAVISSISFLPGALLFAKTFVRQRRAEVAKSAHAPSSHRVTRAQSYLCLSALLLVVAAGALLCAPVAQSQPQSVVATLTDEQVRLEFFKGKIEPLLSTDPTAALQITQSFLTDNPNFDPTQSTYLLLDVANRVYDQVPPEKRRQTAEPILELLDMGQNVWPPVTDPGAGGAALNGRADLQKLAVRIALGENQLSGAQKRIESAWPLALNHFVADWVKLRRDLYLRQGKEAEVIPMIRATLLQRLQLYQSFDLSLCQMMASELSARGQDEEALKWAKLNFVLCPYEEGPLQEAAQTLTQVWLAKEMSAQTAKAFAVAQTEQDGPNPLQGIVLPSMDEPFQEAIAAAIGPVKARNDLGALVGLLLLQGDTRGAMLSARTQLVASAGSPDSLRQVARIFKAKDLNLVRANQFLLAYQSGQDVNPLPGFFQETATTPVATAPVN